jgi:hypothetical protein
MTTTRLTRLALTGGTAALCIGLVAPAVAAADTPSTTATSTVPSHDKTPIAAPMHDKSPQTLTFAQQQARVEAFLAARTKGLKAVATCLANDPRLTAAQQSAITTQLAKDEAAIAAATARVQAATTTAELKAALATLPRPMFAAAHHNAETHARPAKKLANKPADKPATPTETAIHKGNVTVAAGRSAAHRDHHGGFGRGDSGHGRGGHHGGGHH